MLRKLVRRRWWPLVLLSVFSQTSPLAAVVAVSLPPLVSLPSPTSAPRLTSLSSTTSAAHPASLASPTGTADPASLSPAASAPHPVSRPLLTSVPYPGSMPSPTGVPHPGSVPSPTDVPDPWSLPTLTGVPDRGSLRSLTGVTPLPGLSSPTGVPPLAGLSSPTGVPPLAGLSSSTGVPPLTRLPSPTGVIHLASLPAPPSATPQASLSSLAGTPTPAGAGKRHGILYKVSRSGSEAYLFGTIHVGVKSFYPLSSEVHQALAASTEMVLELDTRAERAYAHAVLVHGSYGQGEHLQNFIAPATLERLTQALHALGITVASMAHLKPWLIANILMGLELQRSGFERGQGNEFALLAHAQEHGTNVIELESADYQLALFDTLSAPQSERYLLESLAQLSDGSSLRKAMATIDAWDSADATALDALVPAAIDGDSVMSEFTRRVLLGRRNPEMAARIERIMQDGKTAFVGVGLLHLLGADGLPQLLAQHGYRVERVY